MKKKLIIALSLIVVIVSSFSLGAYAATKLSLKVNGKAIATDIREINGTPYAPIKAITDAIGGYDYKYDKKTGAVTLTPKAAPKSVVGLSRSNPAPLGTAVTVDVADILNPYNASVTINEVIRGEEAWKMIQDANRFNGEPKAGFEYILAKISVKINKTQKADTQVDINSVSFKLVSNAGKDYDVLLGVVEPDPSVQSKLYPGASNTGWAAFQVKKDDSDPLLTFGRKYDGTGGAWFAIK